MSFPRGQTFRDRTAVGEIALESGRGPRWLMREIVWCSDPERTGEAGSGDTEDLPASIGWPVIAVFVAVGLFGFGVHNGDRAGEG